jgi:SAM-dependent methyltransferase
MKQVHIPGHSSLIQTSVLYKDSGRIPFASSLSLRARRVIYQRFMDVLSPGADEIILDIGVTSDKKFPESNFFEWFYPHKNRITCAGTEDGAYLEKQYPGVCFVQVVSGQPLPFPERYFDIAFSNAVLEHVGDREQQRSFIAEILRVSKRFFIVTPNRWFPVEVHTGLPFLHYLPPFMFRKILSRTHFRFWASKKNLNFLSRTELANLFISGMKVTLEFRGIGIGCFRSNLIAYGDSALGRSECD